MKRLIVLLITFLVSITSYCVDMDTISVVQEEVNIKTLPVVWRFIPEGTKIENIKDDSSDIPLTDTFKFSADGNSILFNHKASYNTLIWMEQGWVPQWNTRTFLPDSGHCNGALFFFNEKHQCWVGGIITKISDPLITSMDISPIYSGNMPNWPKIGKEILQNPTVKMRFCLIKKLAGRWRRSSWSYNFE